MPSSTPRAKIFRNAAKLALRKLTTKGSRAATATILVRSSRLLPISVDTNLPHFLLPIGQSSADSNFKISVVYDTCAVLNVDWAAFHLAITKQHPHLVKSLVWTKEQYTALTPSGVVSHNEADQWSAKPVTTLPAIIEYYMPYSSKQGHPTSF
jgi:hypothetical protein